MQTKTLWTNVALGLAGIGTSAWAVHVHRLAKAGQDTGCGISETISCDKVLTSRWAEILGIPVGIYGLIFFGIVIVMAIATRTTKATPREFALQNLGIATLGILSSIGFMFISITQIKAACPVCMSTHTVNTLLFITSLVRYLRLRRVG